jgi:hypothetical protein
MLIYCMEYSQDSSWFKEQLGPETSRNLIIKSKYKDNEQNKK